MPGIWGIRVYKFVITRKVKWTCESTFFLLHICFIFCLFKIPYTCALLYTLAMLFVTYTCWFRKSFYMHIFMHSYLQARGNPTQPVWNMQNMTPFCALIPHCHGHIFGLSHGWHDPQTGVPINLNGSCLPILRYLYLLHR